MLDKFTQLASEAAFSVCIFRDVPTSEFVLAHVSPSLATRQEMGERGLAFVGVAGILRGVPTTKLDEPLGASETSAIAQALVAHIERLLFPTTAFDS